MNITGHTRLACLLGSPVEHSKSPALQTGNFKQDGIDCVYLAFDVKPEQLATAVEFLKNINAVGFNLTMPLKEHIIPYLDEISPAAKLSHSVNTVKIIDGKLYGHTTDGIGFTESVREVGFDLTGSTITVLGAGGAASSMIVETALTYKGVINVFKRQGPTFDTYKEFLDRVSAESGAVINLIDMADTAALGRAIAESSVVVNGTNVGMGDDTRSLVPVEFLRPGLIVMDAVYNPLDTTLLKDAAAAGCTIIHGDRMLYHQGVAAYKIWSEGLL